METREPMETRERETIDARSKPIEARPKSRPERHAARAYEPAPEAAYRRGAEPATKAPAAEAAAHHRTAHRTGASQQNAA